MKIKISEIENYEIQISEEVSLTEVKYLVERLTLLLKFIENKKVKEEEDESEDDKPKKRYKFKFGRNREATIEILKLHYSGNKAEKKEYAKNIGAPDWNYIAKRFVNLRRKWKISPEEVGLQEFPKPGRGTQPLFLKRPQAEYIESDNESENVEDTN